VRSPELVRELGILYHPYDLERGQAQPVEQVSLRFNDVWTRLERIAQAADLPTRARERLAKAQRLTTQLLATITFFFATLQLQIEALALPAELERALVEPLIPALYLDRVATRSTHAEPRHRLRALSHQLLEPLRHSNHPLQALPSARAWNRWPAIAPIASSAEVPGWMSLTANWPCITRVAIA
jgi:hypothetical protein